MVCMAPFSVLFTEALQDKCSVLDMSLSYKALNIISQHQGVSGLLPCFLMTNFCFPDSEAWQAAGEGMLCHVVGSLMGLSLSFCRPTLGELVRGAAASPRG